MRIQLNSHQLPYGEKIEYLQQYGANAISYTTLQDELRDFIVPGQGYASYATYKRYQFFIGNPICRPDFMEGMFDLICAMVEKPVFIQIDEAAARVLSARHGYKIAPLGVEINLPVKEYCLENDPRKRNLRSYLRKGSAQAEVREMTMEALRTEFGMSAEDLESVSRNWLEAKRAKRSLKYVTRRALFQDEPFVRKFYSLDERGGLLGYVFFNPMFRNREIFGYCADIMRAKQSATKGHTAFIIMKALEKFKSEGKSLLSLGLAPTLVSSSINRRGLTGMPYHRLFFALLSLEYRLGNSLYNFSGLTEHKRQYRGKETPVFVATRDAVLPATFSFNRCIGCL